MGEGMKYEVTLKRKPTLNDVQNNRKVRVTVSASSIDEAKSAAVQENNLGKYFVVASVRSA